MHCPIYIGSICVLLEDIGFTPRRIGDDVEPMTYCKLSSVHDKIFADIDLFYMVEVILCPEQIMLDRWTINEERQLYIADESIDLDIHDPQCVSKVTHFFYETMALSQGGPIEYY